MPCTRSPASSGMAGSSAVTAGYCTIRASARRMGVSLAALGLLTSPLGWLLRANSSAIRCLFSPQRIMLESRVINPSRVKPSGTRRISSAALLATSNLPASPERAASRPRRSNMKSAKGWASSSKASNPSLPIWRTRESGSSPSGRNTNLSSRPSCRWESALSSARQAASRPALSPS
ncbi:hypothetical protein D3C79_701050 [compost metagenome]